jgi:hypothetical protein
LAGLAVFNNLNGFAQIENLYQFRPTNAKTSGTPQTSKKYGSSSIKEYPCRIPNTKFTILTITQITAKVVKEAKRLASGRNQARPKKNTHQSTSPAKITLMLCMDIVA